jgi:hypothetical protein
VALHPDADRRSAGAEEFGPGESEGDQQDVLHAGVEGRRDLTEQRTGGGDVQ